MQENVAALLSYLVGWITGLVFYLIDKRPYVRFHAAQSIVVFGGLHIILIVVGMVFGFGFGFGHFGALGIGFLLYGLIDLAAFVLWILCMVKGYQGEKFKLPIAGDIAEKMAG
ncbi:MAG: DUF4870 domain-containing protein [Candidatus Acidiferrales bacterium]